MLFSRHLSATPHLAGTAADWDTADQLRQFWQHEACLDQVHIYPYDVLLSYPDIRSPNKIVIKDENDQDIFTTQLFEKVLDPDQNQTDVIPPFNAYSASGEPKVCEFIMYTYF